MSIRRRIRAGAATAAVVGSLLLAFVPSASATFPGRNGRLAVAFCFNVWFCENHLGSTSIGTMRADGSGRRRLTHQRAHHSQALPTWAPNGRRLLFEDNQRLETIGPGGRHLVRLPRRLRGVGDASYAPDGGHLVYTRQRSDGVQIYRARLDGTHARRLHEGSSPRWSPDGKTIAFVTATTFASDGTWASGGEIWLMRASDGAPIRKIADSVTTKLTGPPGVADHGAGSLDWSPDSSRLVYTEASGSTANELIVASADGSGSTPITSIPRVVKSAAVWSPDGKLIAFAGSFSGQGAVGDIVRLSIRIVPANGGVAKTIWRHTYNAEGFVPSPPQISWQSLGR